jgi:serine/threonine protein kinase
MAADEQLTGQVLDEKYRLDRQLGEGGMGAVYLATHVGTRRPVALKVIRPQFMNHPEFVERFRREAEAAGRLRHPNVVNVTDFGFARIGSQRLAYLIMEYLDGCTLGEVLREERSLPLSWTVDIIEQICSAVGEAHRLGIIHRDLKPDNIWLEPDRRGGYNVKVLDFGLAKLRDTAAPVKSISNPRNFHAHSQEASSAATAIHPQSHRDIYQTSERTIISTEEVGEKTTLLASTPDTNSSASSDNFTAVGSVLGTPLYMSPEQCRGELLDGRSDIYSLGVIVYQMLCGETPFHGTFETLIDQHIKAAPPPLKDRCRNLPKMVESLVMSALAKNPAQRPTSAIAFADALRARAENTGTLLRQVYALYIDKFPLFIRVSCIAHLPMIIVSMLQLINKTLLAHQILMPFASQAIGLFLLLLFFASGLFSNSLNASTAVPVVAQLLVAPLRPIHIGPILIALKQRSRAFTTTFFIAHTIILLRSILFIVPGFIAMVDYILWVPIVIMEGLQGRAAMKRAAELAARKRGTVTILLFVFCCYAFLFSTIFFLLAGAFGWLLTGEFFHSLVLALHSKLFIYTSLTCQILLGILIDPIIAIELAMIYFKTCQAGGESIKDTLGQFEEKLLPNSGWQARIQDRIRRQINSNR